MIEERILMALGEVDQKFIEEADPEMIKDKRYRIFIEVLPLVACLGLFIMGFTLAYKIGIFNRSPLEGEESADTSSIEETMKDGIFSEDQEEFNIKVNNLDDLVSADLDVLIHFYDILPKEERVEEALDLEANNIEEALEDEPEAGNKVLDEFERANNMSFDSFNAKLPDEWELEKFYTLSSRANTSDNYAIHDYVFEYKREAGGKALIAMCNFEKPLRDWFIAEDNPEISRINGIELTIYRYKNIIITDFFYQDVNFDITTTDISIKDLQDLLINLINN